MKQGLSAYRETCGLLRSLEKENLNERSTKTGSSKIKVLTKREESRLVPRFLAVCWKWGRNWLRAGQEWRYNRRGRKLRVRFGTHIWDAY